MHSKVKSDFLVAQPSFLSGMGRLFDWYGLYDAYNTSRTGGEADYKALLSDWLIVGQDIENAMGEFKRSLPTQPLDSDQYELFVTR